MADQDDDNDVTIGTCDYCHNEGVELVADLEIEVKTTAHSSTLCLHVCEECAHAAAREFTEMVAADRARGQEA